MITLADGNYEVVDVLGHGGMSTVYLARHVRLESLWAIKQIHKNKYEQYDFRREADLLRQIDHPMFPYLVGVWEDDADFYMIEEYINGVNLQNWLEENTMAEEETGKQWFLSLCRALAYVHSFSPPVIYSDMKPSNIMLQPDGRLRLLDLGIAREKKDTGEIAENGFGTYGYAAPEQFGEGTVDRRTDIYSLGVTMYHLLTGKNPCEPPFTFENAWNHHSGLSAGMEHILRKCTQSDPELRYSTIDDLVSDLENIQQFDEAYRLQKAKKKRHVLIACASAAIALFCVFAGLRTYETSTQKSREARMRELEARREDAVQRSSLEQGLLFLAQGQLEKAEDKFDASIAEDAKNPDAYMGRGDTRRKMAEKLGDSLEMLDRKETCLTNAQEDYRKAEELGDAAASEKLESTGQELDQIASDKELRKICREFVQAFAENDRDKIYELYEQMLPYARRYFAAHNRYEIVWSEGSPALLCGVHSEYYVYYGEVAADKPQGHGILVSEDSSIQIWLESDWEEGVACGEALEVLNDQSIWKEDRISSVARSGFMTDGVYEGEVTAAFAYQYLDSDADKEKKVNTSYHKVSYDFSQGIPQSASGIEEVSKLILSSDYKWYRYDTGVWREWLITTK